MLPPVFSADAALWRSISPHSIPELARIGKGFSGLSRLTELARGLRLPLQRIQRLLSMSLVQAITAPPQITAALQQASAKTGADFSYLLKTAMRESSLNCHAKSATSSACGLFQFTEQTWLGTMKQSGAELGLGEYADAITQDSNGRYRVTDPADRQEILALRNDAGVSALMAGALTNASRDRLEGNLGREVNGGELYIAHFLGAGGASKLISSTEETPNVPADELFPSAAAANRSIFYARDGSPRSVSEVYNNLVAKHRNTTGEANATVASSSSRPTVPLSRPSDLQNFSRAISLNNTRPDMAQTEAAISAYSAPATGRTGSTIHNLGGRAPLTLTPGVIEILASLSVPDTSNDNDLDAALERRSERDEEAERQQTARLMLPRGGRALG